jgi:UDP-N-acetylglucosamine--N-acetylmuramyl-(pentapeptide) pyrophosphoryl-undecaprenol N-acetylglucosamine transferase
MPADPTSTWALIAGGGTGGHVYPGLTIAAELVERGHPASSIHWIGSEIGVEVDLVPAAGFGLTVLPGRGLNGRRIDLDNLRAAIGLVRASLRGIGEVRRRRPAVVLSLGGYAAVAAVVGAAVCRVPLVVTEQNVRGSLANRLAARFARVCAVPFEGSDLPKAVVTGNPVRPEIVEASHGGRPGQPDPAPGRAGRARRGDPRRRDERIARRPVRQPCCRRDDRTARPIAATWSSTT